MTTATYARLVFLAAVTFASSAAAQINAPSSSVDLSQLTEHFSAAVLSANTAAYDVLDVPAMSAGTSFSDPVTGVRTVKVTDGVTPKVSDAAGWVTLYSTMGLQISQAWGANLDQYTFIFHTPAGDAYLVDYQLGGRMSNYRPAPEGEGQVAFARTVGNERVMYVATGSQLRRYDTSIDSFVDTGGFPYSWNTASNAAAWLSLNADETRATAMQSGGSTCTSLNLVTGAVITQSPSGLNELAIGSSDTAYVISNPQKHWDLATNTLTELAIPTGWSKLSHTAQMDGFAFHFDVDAGGGVWPITHILDNNTFTTPFGSISGYWRDSHSSGHWWDVPAGTDPHALMTHNGSSGRGAEPTWEFALMFVNTRTGSKRILGHHYSLKPSGIAGPASAYYDQPHATISNDGKLVIFGSSMNQTKRRDVFVMEVPRTDTTPIVRPQPPAWDD